MASLPVSKPDEEAERDRATAERRAAAILKSVLTTMGRPVDFFRVTIRLVHGDNFRVNVLTGPDAASARIAHSFFVTADERGTITACNPALQKLPTK
jgi:hypothetical protein